MQQDNRSPLARKLDYWSARILMLFLLIILFTRMLPVGPGILLAGSCSYLLHRMLRVRQHRHLTHLAQQRQRSKWWEETKNKMSSLGPTELASWTIPYLSQLGLSQPACPLNRPGIQLEARLGRSPVAVAVINQSQQPISKTALADAVNSLPPSSAGEKLLLISSGSFSLESHRWSRSRGKGIKLLEGERLLDLAWQLQDQYAIGEPGTGPMLLQKPATLAELQQHTHRRIIYGVHSSLYLLLWSLVIGGWLRYYYLITVLIIVSLLLYYYRLLARYRSLASPDWEAWLEVEESS